MKERMHFVRMIVLCLMAAFLAVAVLTLGASEQAQAGTSEPEPLGDAGSGWIFDELVDFIPDEDKNPVLATGPGGMLHAAWQHDSNGAGDWDICYAYSTDGGKTWSGCTPVAMGNIETNPDIAVSPQDGRIFIAYEMEQILGNREIFVAHSDNGMVWTPVMVSASPMDEFNPSITLEHDMPAYMVHVAFEEDVPADGHDLHVYGSPDRGISWLPLFDYGVGDIRVFSEPELEYQRCTDALPRLYMLYIMDYESVEILWSEDHGMTWLGPGSVWSDPEIKSGLTVASSRDGDTLIAAWEEQVPLDYRMRYAFNPDPTSPPGPWMSSLIDTFNLNDRAPKLVADGEGTMSTSIGGRFHLVWTVATVSINYTSVNTDMSGGFAPSETPSDSVAMHAQGSPKGLTTQNRGGTWFPAISWMDGRMMDWDIYYTTPGSRVTVDANITGLYMFVDGQNITLPKAYNWPAGLNHSFVVPSPQSINATARAVWLDWSDTGAQNHSVQATTFDTIYTAGFMFQYRVDFDPSPLMGGFEIEVDGTPYSIPRTFWWWIGTTYEIFAPSPQQQAPTSRWVFDYWSDFGAQRHDITIWGPDQYVVYFTRQWQWTIVTSPSGLNVEIDLAMYVAPVSFWWDEGSSHGLYAPSPQQVSADTRYVYDHWSGGGAQGHNITISGGGLRTAFYDTEYLETITSIPVTGLDVEVDGVPRVTEYQFWCTNGSMHTINAMSPQSVGPNSRYVWVDWSDGLGQSHTITCNGPNTYIASFALEHQIIITSNPGGRLVIVDTVTQVTPYAVWWGAGEVHNLDVLSPQPEFPGSSQFVWTSWSDGGAQNHDITVTGPDTIVASFTRQYKITITTSPAGLEILADSVPHTTPYEVWWDESSSHSLDVLDPQVVAPGERYMWASWSDAGAQNHNIIVAMSMTYTAFMDHQFELMIGSAPMSGLTVTVDGMDYPTPYLFWCDDGSSHSISAIDFMSVGPNVRAAFSSWSDGGARTHNIICDMPKTLIATYTTQFYLTVSSPYGTTSGEGWYDDGAQASAGLDTDVYVVAPNAERFVFTNWGGDASGADYALSDPILMDAPKTASALWMQQYYLLVNSPYGTTGGEGWYDQMTTAYAGLDIDTWVIIPNEERFTFQQWSSDATGGNFAQSDPITMDGPKLAQAEWIHEVYLSVSSPYGTPSGEGWFNAGATVFAGLDIDLVVIVPNEERYIFSNWGGDATGSDYLQSDQILMDSPKTADAIWRHEYSLSIQSTYGTPIGEGWFEEMTAVPAGLDIGIYVVTPGAERFVFLQWTGDATGIDYMASDPIVMNGPKTAIAQWTHEYYMTVDTSYGTPTGEDWYVDGTQAYAGLDTDTYVVIPNVERYIFVGWDKDATGTDYVASDPILMDAPKTADAVWLHQYWIVVRAESGGTPLLGIAVSTEAGVVGTTPYSEWFNDAMTYDIGVEDPADVGGTDYEFLYWDYGPTDNPVSYTVAGSATIIAEYQEIVGPYFEVHISPASRQIAAGEVTTYYVNVSSHNGYAGTVSLTLSGLVAPAQGTFNPTSVLLVADATEMSVLTISNTGSLAQTTHTLTVTGNDGTMTDGEDASLVVSGIAATGSISGTVTDQDLALLAGASVDLMVDQTVQSTQTTGSGGEFNFTDLGAGAYTVRASLSGYADDNETVTLTAGGWETATLQLDEIRGSVSGVVKDKETLAIIEGATVEAYDLSGNLLGSDTSTATGRFLIQDLPLGTFDLRAWAEGYEMETVPDLQATAVVHDVGDVFLTPEAEPAGAAGLADYWWVILIIAVVVVLLLVLVAKRRKPEETEALDEGPEEPAELEEAETLEEGDLDELLDDEWLKEIE